MFLFLHFSLLVQGVDGDPDQRGQLLRHPLRRRRRLAERRRLPVRIHPGQSGGHRSGRQRPRVGFIILLLFICGGAARSYSTVGIVVGYSLSCQLFV